MGVLVVDGADKSDNAVVVVAISSVGEFKLMESSLSIGCTVVVVEEVLDLVVVEVPSVGVSSWQFGPCAVTGRELGHLFPPVCALT